MREAEWMKCQEAAKMLEALRHRASDRKLSLFSIACIRSYEPMTRKQQTIAFMTERYVEGLATKEEMRQAWELTRWAWPEEPWRWAANLVTPEADEVPSPPPPIDFPCTLRDIFGPLPFRPVALDLGSLSPTVKGLAESIYQDRAFDRLPILADALEEAGCTQPDVLAHLRSGGEHVRGCWALDLVLGKA